MSHKKVFFVPCVPVHQIDFQFTQLLSFFQLSTSA